MEKELVETFEIAKKAADAAVAPDGGSEEMRCIDAIKRLRSIPVNTDVLTSTQIGKHIRSFTKHPREKIQAAASELLALWKKKVKEEAVEKWNKENPNGKAVTKSGTSEGMETGISNNSTSVKVQVQAIKSEKTQTQMVKVENTEKMQQSEIMKVDNANKAVKISASEHVKIEKPDRSISIPVDRSREENGKSTVGVKRPLPDPACPPKLTSMVKCNDIARDKLRELIAEALSKVSGEAGEDVIKEVNACDPIRVAVMVESVMFQKLGRNTGPHKVKYRSIMFNLKDGNNPDLRRRVLLGEIKPEKLIEMTPEEMASDQRKRENLQIKEKAMFECERGVAPKATTDQFKCGRCGQRKTTYYQLQTRSADEPMTTFVTCVNCNNRWKFC